MLFGMPESKTAKEKLIKMNNIKKNCENVKNKIIFNNMFVMSSSGWISENVDPIFCPHYYAQNSMSFNHYDNHSEGNREAQTRASIKKSLSRNRKRKIF